VPIAAGVEKLQPVPQRSIYGRPVSPGNRPLLLCFRRVLATAVSVEKDFWKIGLIDAAFCLCLLAPERRVCGRSMRLRKDSQPVT